jgi:hypothetical protein
LLHHRRLRARAGLAARIFCVVIGIIPATAMASDSFSFRITRSAEDLAQTTHALSQRLVTLEQRLETLELELLRLQDSADSSEPEQRDSLETVERLMHDCRSLLGLESEPGFTPSVSGSEFAEAA